MAMVVCMCLGISSCTHRNREIEGIAQRECKHSINYKF